MDEGQLIAGRYRLLAPLGHGATGAVYHACDVTDGREYGLKLIDRDLSSGAYADQLMRVAGALRGLECPYLLAPIRSGFHDDGRFWQLTPLLRHVEALSAVLEREGVLPAQLALEWLGRVCAAVAMLHARGLLHADIKPENILVDVRRGRPILADFGMARRVESGEQVLLVSTLGYLHPALRSGMRDLERTRAGILGGEVALGPFVDVYSLGLVGFRMLAGTGLHPAPLTRSALRGLLSYQNASVASAPARAVDLVVGLLYRMLAVPAREAEGEALELAMLAMSAADEFRSGPKDGVAESSRNVLSKGRLLLDRYSVGWRLRSGVLGLEFAGIDLVREEPAEPVTVMVPHDCFREWASDGFPRSAARLLGSRHPHMVQILGQGVEDRVPFLVLQHVLGASLVDRLDEAGGRQPPQEVLSWLLPIALALDFLHQQEVVHGYLTPRSILFDDDRRAYLSNCWIGIVSHMVGAWPLDAAVRGDREMDAFFLRPSIAPEEMTGNRLTGTADQYALATTLYEALGGRRPFEAPRTAILLRKLREDPLPLGELAPHVPAAVCLAVMKALARDPGKRFATCVAFAEAVEAGLA